jgi:hypothetical protein
MYKKSKNCNIKYKLYFKMTSKLYITEVENFEQNDSPISKKANKNIKEVQHHSSYLIKNDKEFNKATGQVLDFLVNEETQFTDLSKIEDYFKSSAVNNYHSFNSNRNDIRKKNQELEILQSVIDQVSLIN